jgi:hypothetical protein
LIARVRSLPLAHHSDTCHITLVISLHNATKPVFPTNYDGSHCLPVVLHVCVCLHACVPAMPVCLRSPAGLAPLHLACRSGRVEAVRALYRAQADLALADATVAARQHSRSVGSHSGGNGGRSPAHWAAAAGHASTLRALAELGAPLALPDASGDSPAYGAWAWPCWIVSFSVSFCV